MLELTALDLDEIATALADQGGYEHCWLINTTTGELVFWTRDTGIDGHHPIDLDDLDPDLLGIDPLPSHVWYHDMAEFADQINDDRAAHRLGRAIQGRGAFRRFKDELHDEYPELVRLPRQPRPTPRRRVAARPRAHRSGHRRWLLQRPSRSQTALTRTRPNECRSVDTPRTSAAAVRACFADVRGRRNGALPSC